MKARSDVSLAVNKQLLYEQAASESLLVEAARRLERSNAAHESELTAQGTSTLRMRPSCRGQCECRNKVANQPAESSSLALRVAHEATAAVTKAAHQHEIASSTLTYTALRDARAVDAERVRAIEEQHQILTSAKVSEAEFK